MPKHTYTETKIIHDLATIMANNQGPFTRKMLAEHLSKVYPEKYYQELMNEISYAIQMDRMINKRFSTPQQGWYDLAGKKSWFVAKY